jgi:hypothetical protein
MKTRILNGGSIVCRGVGNEQIIAHICSVLDCLHDLCVRVRLNVFAKSQSRRRLISLGRSAQFVGGN